jgi:release factor glutamine methyltransferase
MSEDAEVLELGTGSGAIALALAHERPGWSITATDVSRAALEVARVNATRYEMDNVDFRQGDWFDAEAKGRRFSLIVSNPPYVAVDDPCLSSGDLRFEPHCALVAEEDGLRCLRHLIAEAPFHLDTGGWLWLEHGATQGPSVRSQLSQCGFDSVQTRRDLAGLERCSGARLSGQ